MKENDVVICDTGQAGTVVQATKDQVWVLLANLEMWIGSPKRCRYPQDAEDLAAALTEVDRFEGRERRKPSV